MAGRKALTSVGREPYRVKIHNGCRDIQREIMKKALRLSNDDANNFYTLVLADANQMRENNVVQAWSSSDDDDDE